MSRLWRISSQDFTSRKGTATGDIFEPLPDSLKPIGARGGVE